MTRRVRRIFFDVVLQQLARFIDLASTGQRHGEIEEQSGIIRPFFKSAAVRGDGLVRLAHRVETVSEHAQDVDVICGRRSRQRL